MSLFEWLKMHPGVSIKVHYSMATGTWCVEMGTRYPAGFSYSWVTNVKDIAELDNLYEVLQRGYEELVNRGGR